jgi:hypothetical protein
MPKNDINYSDTIIYKIYCNDKTIHDVYVGHTTNFTKRKYVHKILCNNLNNKTKIYNIIRQNGGWDNWEMVEIAKYNCKNKTEARIKEQQHYEELNSTLNSCPPYNKDKNIIQKIMTKMNNCEQIEQIEKTTENNNFVCNICDYSCIKKSNYERHLLTNRHKQKELKYINKQTEQNTYICICGKQYMFSQGLSKHKKKCNQIINNNTIIELTNDELIKKNNELLKHLINENKELKNLIIEVCKKIPGNNITNQL